MGAGEIARAYHDHTKHTYESIRRGGRTLDWSTKPDPFKRYDGRPVVTLAADAAAGGTPLLEALVRSGHGSAPSLGSLARIIAYGAGVIRRQTYADDVLYFRTYASAGALYPVELYAMCGAIDGLDVGVYHFDPLAKALTVLRTEAIGAEDGCAQLILTGIPWRTCWKYGARGYRHLFWDAGTILANIVALRPRTSRRTSWRDSRTTPSAVLSGSTNRASSRCVS